MLMNTAFSPKSKNFDYINLRCDTMMKQKQVQAPIQEIKLNNDDMSCKR